MRLLFLTSVVFACALAAHGQSVSTHITNLEAANSPDEFRKAFDAMITDLHAGKLEFKREDVLTIVEIARKKPFEGEMLASVFGWLGTMFGDGRMDEALVFFMEHAELYRKEGNVKGEALCYFEVALIQHKAENYAEAEEYYHKALEVGTQILPYRTTINCHNGLALILRQRGACDTAVTDFRKALRVAELHDDIAWTGILSGNIGSCHLATGNYDSSLFYYHKNLALIRKTNEFENEIETYVQLGRVYLKKSDLSKSKKYLDSALLIVNTRKIAFNDFFNPMDLIHETYALLFSATGDYKKAFEHYSEFHRVSEEKQEKINGRSLKQLQSVYAFNKNQNEIKLLRQINEANLTVIKQQKYITWSFAVIILLMAGIAAAAYRSGRQRKRMNKYLTNSNAELERLNSVKDMLFSVISHDLRSPIANLRTTLELLNDENLTQKELSMISEKLGHQLEVSGNALENVLQWAKAQLNNMAVTPTNVNASALVANILSQLAIEIQEKNLDVRNKLSAEATLWGDKDQLEVVIRNVLTNAIKFTPNQGVIRIFGEQDDQFLHMTFEDSGVGMSEAQLKNLFEPGLHTSTTGTNQERGTGIGLIITKELIANNGGTIQVKSRQNEGTKFIISVPVSKKLL